MLLRFCQILLACVLLVTTLATAQGASKNRPVLVQPQSHTCTAAFFHSGSLKANLIRSAHRCGWNKVVWQVPGDYHWYGNLHVHGEGLSSIYTQILGDHFPIQANFYTGNHVLVFIPRDL